MNRRKSNPQHPYIFFEEKCVGNSLTVAFIKGGPYIHEGGEKEENVRVCMCVCACLYLRFFHMAKSTLSFFSKFVL